MAAEVIAIESSPVFLPEDQPLRRLPRAPWRPRPKSFWNQFEDRALFYDCFWAADGRDILLVGPPPQNLAPHFAAARYVAMPSGRELLGLGYPSRSTMFTRLAEAPADTTHIELSLSGTSYRIFVQPSAASRFADRRVLIAVQKDNDPGWIEFWARWHVRFQNVDAIILFDNGSSAYALSELRDRLRAIPGLKVLGLVSWPWRFGVEDPSVVMHRFWPHYLQISAMLVALRRFAPRAAGLLNCDIDELAAPLPGQDLFDLTKASDAGFLVLKGQWIEAVTSTPAIADHSVFRHRLRDARRDLCADKWVLDPARDWVSTSEVFPYWHSIKGEVVPEPATRRGVGFWHFRGINNGWKRRAGKASPPSFVHEVDPELAGALNLCHP